MRHTIRVFATLAAILALLPATVAAARVVAVGDVHGDADSLSRILTSVNLTDASGAWAGGEAVLVQTGDLLDRGTDDRRVLEYLMRLEGEARRAGGRVEVLLGNHEVMNLLGDLRYVNPAVYESFADARSEKRRRRAWKQVQRYWKQREKRLGPAAGSLETERAWLARHPLGYFEHREAFSPRGRYGKWLRKKMVVALVGGTLFLHGGLSEQLPDTVEGINQRVAEEIRQLDRICEYLVRREVVLPFFRWQEMRAAVVTELEHQMSQQPRPDEELVTILRAFLQSESWLIQHPQGPLWNRSLASEPETPESLARLDELLARYGATRVVVGHTPQLGNGINTRFDGKVVLIDTGMLVDAYPGGVASALVIEGGELRFLYP